MADLRGLRYVQGDQVKAGGINLRGLPLESEGDREPIGELDGLLIDLEARRVRYLVVETAHTGQKHLLPLDATALDPETGVLERVSSDDSGSYQRFDPSMVDEYDEDALVSMLFRSKAS